MKKKTTTKKRVKKTPDPRPKARTIKVTNRKKPPAKEIISSKKIRKIMRIKKYKNTLLMNIHSIRVIALKTVHSFNIGNLVKTKYHINKIKDKIKIIEETIETWEKDK